MGKENKLADALSIRHRRKVNSVIPVWEELYKELIQLDLRVVSKGSLQRESNAFEIQPSLFEEIREK